MASAQPELYRHAYQEMFTAAAPIARLGTAYEAESAISLLLGGVYRYAIDGDRRVLLTAFVDDFVKYLQRRRSPEVLAVLAGLSAVAPGVGGERAGKAVQRFVDRDIAGPRWLDQVGKVRCAGAHLVRDAYGDQSQYVLTYEYDTPDPGGPEHAVAVIVDHNRRMVSDIAVASPARPYVANWHEVAGQTQGHISVTTVEPAQARTQVEQHLVRTELERVPPSQQFQDNWAFAVARLAALPDAPGAPPPPPMDDAARDLVVRAFLGSPQAERAADQMAQHVAAPSDVVRHAARLAVDYALDANSGDPLRWSPTAVRDMLLEWVPQRSGVPTEVSSWLPEVLDAFSEYAGEARALSRDAMAGTRMAIADITQEYTNRMMGDADSEPMDVVFGRMLADGVDPSDEAASRRWLTEYLEKRNPPSG